MSFSALIGISLAILDPLYGMLGCVLSFSLLEWGPWFFSKRTELMKKEIEEILSNRFDTQIKLEQVFWRRGPFKLKSDVQTIYDVQEGLSKIKGRPYDEIWVLIGNWFWGPLKPRRKIVGIKGNEVTVILES